jgi:hypothetical protein
MANVDNTNDLTCVYITNLGNWIGLATGLPGSTQSPANEAVGGSPAYARQPTTWTVTGATAIGSPVTLNVPPGTYTYMLMCSASSGNNCVDWQPISAQTPTVQTTITITPTYTIS